MTNTDFNATATDLLLALADLASPQTDDTLDEINRDFATALDQLDCDDNLRDALLTAQQLINDNAHTLNLR
jgi:hypothetical protein